MPHFYPSRLDGDRVEIEGADARHLAGPLRARPGQAIAVVDPAGRLLTVRLETVSTRLVRGAVVEAREHRPEPRLAVTMALALLPAAALEHSLTRCTELGAARFLLLEAERSVSRASRPERWAAICREAAMLAGRLTVPEVEGPVPASSVLSQPETLVLDAGAERPLAAAGLEGPLTLAIGPEGGWSEAERELAGDRRRSLGRLVLRADTAAVAALATALSASESG